MFRFFFRTVSPAVNSQHTSTDTLCISWEKSGKPFNNKSGVNIVVRFPYIHTVHLLSRCRITAFVYFFFLFILKYFQDQDASVFRVWWPLLLGQHKKPLRYEKHLKQVIIIFPSSQAYLREWQILVYMCV